ncbi:DoxX family protein [Cecembia rubra]|uniref:Putative oxidoreductase n=1 Tax=Cecembia rubra TaxID=1485585 RepID=A0A2P8ECT5_9BACT|nr:DoxX family protein [Cecembia rubra]PSL07278.1 putative oxidoreductase [Cecembia rubra]
MKAFFYWLFSTYSTGKKLDFGLLLLRLFFALPLTIRHGWPTLFQWWKGEISYPDPLGLGENLTMLIMGSIEAFCATFVVLGLFTRISAFFVAAGFTVAVLVVHGTDTFAVKELAYMYMAGFWSVFFLGSGKYALDFLIFGKSQGKRLLKFQTDNA